MMATLKHRVKPISPIEILNQLEDIIPTVVIEAVNNLLKKEFRGNDVSIKQKEIIAEIQRLDSTITSNALINNRWLDFEKIFNKNGWSVTYESPAYSENFEAYYKFKPKNKNKTYDAIDAGLFGG